MKVSVKFMLLIGAFGVIGVGGGRNGMGLVGSEVKTGAAQVLLAPCRSQTGGFSTEEGVCFWPKSPGHWSPHLKINVY